MIESEQAEPKGLDLPRLFALTLAHKGWVLWPTAAALAGALAFVMLVKPHYTATTKVLLEDGESYYTRPDKAPPSVAEIIDEFAVASEAEAAKSPDVERKAMEKLKPEDLEEFSGRGLFSLFSPRSDDPDTRRIEAFAKALDVYPQAKTRVLLFEFTSIDRARARRGAEALAEAFLESQRNAKDEGTKSASRWLSGEIDALRAKVADAEAKVEALRGQAGLQAGTNGVAVPSQQLGEIAGQIASARAAASAAQAKAAALRELVHTGRFDDIAAVANDESLRRYAETRVAVKAQIAENLRTLLPGHPRMKELSGELAGLEQQIREAATKRVQGLESEARIAADQVKSLQAAVADQAKTVSSGDADQAKLRELEIDAKTARDQLESYLTKYREAISRDAASASPANGRIVAHALTPLSPSFPKTGPTLLLAPLAAFFISLGLVVAKILLTDDGAPARPARPAAVPAVREEPAPSVGLDTLARKPKPEPQPEHHTDAPSSTMPEPPPETRKERSPAPKPELQPETSYAPHPAPRAEAPPAPKPEPRPELQPEIPYASEPERLAEAPPKPEPELKSEIPPAPEPEPLAQTPPEPEAASAPEPVKAEAPPEPDTPAWTPQVERYVDRLADASEGESLQIMVTGAGPLGVLPVALTAARRLSRRGPTALVDLGPSPPWLSDLFEASRDPRKRATLAELADDPVLLTEVAERDLSTPLDIFPSKGVDHDDDLQGLWVGLSKLYAFVVVHAPDWRDPVCIDAVEEMAAMLVVAPAPELEAVEARVRRAFQAEDVAIKGFDYDARAQARAA